MARIRSRRLTHPPPQGDTPDHEVNDDGTGDSADEEGRSGVPEDLLDGTTQQHPHGTPPDLLEHPAHHQPFIQDPIGFEGLSSDTTRQRFQGGPLDASPSLSTPSPEHPGLSSYSPWRTQCHYKPSVIPGKRKSLHEERAEASIPEAPHSHHHHQGPTPAFLIFIVLLILMGIFSLYQALHKAKEEQRLKQEPKLITDIYSDIKSELQGISRDFSQPREVWLGLLSQLEAVMVEEPLQPAILLVVVPEDSKGTATCLTYRLARAIQDAFEDRRFVMFHTRDSGHQDDAELLKMELDESLQALSQVHAAVVHNVESIPGPAAMILHAYCDNDNAPYKQAIIFLLVEIPGIYDELGHRRLDKLVDSHLTQQWGAGLAEKDVSALISRTSNTPLLIRPERPGRVLELCPL